MSQILALLYSLVDGKSSAHTYLGAVVLSDLAGGIVQMSEAQLVSLEGHINAGTMPKLTAASRAAGVTPLTADEKTAWVEEIRRQRKR